MVGRIGRNEWYIHPTIVQLGKDGFLESPVNNSPNIKFDKLIEKESFMVFYTAVYYLRNNMQIHSFCLSFDYI